MSGKRGGQRLGRPRAHNPSVAGSIPAPASSPRPDSPRGKQASRRAAHRSSPPANNAPKITITEAQLQAQVIQLAQLNGYRVAHFRPALNKRGQWQTAVAGDGKGYPDLTLVGNGRILFVELKSDRGTLEPEQREWLEAIEAAGGTALVWRPRDWPEIERTLARERQ